MGSVITKIDDHPFGDVPARAGVTVDGRVQSRAVLDSEDRPILLWMHRLEPGARLTWERPAQDHLVYVWEGQAFSGSERMGVDEAFVVEHGGRGEIHAGDTPAVVLHFHRPEDFPEPPPRGGGHVHVLAGAAVRRGIDLKHQVGRSLFADAACPTCAVWLHGNQLPFGEGAPPHHHNNDEIIVITAGKMQLGRIGHGRGTVVAIDQETRYAFKCGEEGLSFINFRPDTPVLFIEGRPPADERARLLKGLSRSAPVTVN